MRLDLVLNEEEKKERFKLSIAQRSKDKDLYEASTSQTGEKLNLMSVQTEQTPPVASLSTRNSSLTTQELLISTHRSLSFDQTPRLQPMQRSESHFRDLDCYSKAFPSILNPGNCLPVAQSSPVFLPRSFGVPIALSNFSLSEESLQAINNSISPSFQTGSNIPWISRTEYISQCPASSGYRSEESSKLEKNNVQV